MSSSPGDSFFHSFGLIHANYIHFCATYSFDYHIMQKPQNKKYYKKNFQAFLREIDSLKMISTQKPSFQYTKKGGSSYITVSGRPCRAGTKCEKNRIAGFYSCELEGGEVGSWDFCCRDDHPCGYSRDFEYPW